jgi:glutaconate CoA-transferase, subunit A
MQCDRYTDIEKLVTHVDDGDVVALAHTISADFSAASMVATPALIRREVKRLHLVGVPALSLQADILIGAGCVATVESGSILRYEYGAANRFVAAQKSGAIMVKDSTCPAIHSSLIAGAKGLPFLPIRGLIGSDVLRHRVAHDGWKVIENPFADDDPIVVVPARRPDVALFHVPLADAWGNVWIGRRDELGTMAHSARKVLVTCETVSERNLVEDETLAPATISEMYVTGLSHQPNGSWPLFGGPGHPEDRQFMHDYARCSKSDEGFREFLAGYLAAR